jgi:hypothetical protein
VPADEQAQSAPAFYIGINIAVATISAWANGPTDHKSIVRALEGGVIGGTLMYVGQQIIRTREPALRFLGVQTVALGANLARNIGSGVAPTATLVLPLLPFYLTVQPKQRHVQLRVSAAALVGIANMSAHGRKLDMLQSLYSGALVFSQAGAQIHCYDWDGDTCLRARVAEHRIGSIAYAQDPQPLSQRAVIAHELGHVTQDVRDLLLYAVPVSDFVLRNSGKLGRALADYVVIDAFLPLMAASDIFGPPRFDEACHGLSRFYECEVYALIH